MKKLIIITGVSGTGKTSLSKEMYKRLESSTWLSLDMVLENIYDLIGFKNKKEKRPLRILGKNLYKKLVKEAIKREDPIIILEYPFKKEWTSFFKEIENQGDYEIYTINMFAKDFDTIWKRLLKRESSPERHPSHYLESYNVRNKDKYKPYFEYDYKKHKKEYEELTSNSIKIGTNIKIEDIEQLDIDDLIQKIVKNNDN